MKRDQVEKTTEAQWRNRLILAYEIIDDTYGEITINKKNVVGRAKNFLEMFSSMVRRWKAHDDLGENTL